MTTRTMIPTKTLETFEAGPFRANLIRESYDPVMNSESRLWSVDVWKGYFKQGWVSKAFIEEDEARAHFVKIQDKLILKTAMLALNL